MANQTLVLAISGCSGGALGPQGIYSHFQAHWNHKHVKILQVNTIPDSVEENVEMVANQILTEYGSYNNIYIVGYSMGGAVAVQVADRLREDAIAQGTETRCKGIALLATQTDGLRTLQNLDIPVLFYHGTEDDCFPLWEIQSIYEHYKGAKKMIQANGLGHNLAHTGDRFISKQYAQFLAKNVISELRSFFAEPNGEQSAAEIHMNEIPLSFRDRCVNQTIRFFLPKRA